MPGVTLLGLGPGDSMLLTRQAWEVLNDSKEIWLRTKEHPTVTELPPTVTYYSFDDYYEQYDSFEEVYRAIVDKVIELAKRPEGVVYAVPGHPFVAERTGPEIARRANLEKISLRIIDGLSFLESVFSALGIDPYPRLVFQDAIELSGAHIPQFPPDTAVLIAQIYSRLVAAEVKQTLLEVYPENHPVKLIHMAGTSTQKVDNLQLYEIDRNESLGLLTTLYVSPLGEGTSFEGFQEVVAHLRAPDGCPWDREQTHQSLKRHLLEETYEAISALDDEDTEKMREEFGDLLLQIVLQAQIASESGEFTMTDVIKGIHDKIIRRHPHVFGDTKVSGVHEVLKNWEQLKEAERINNGERKGGLLDGVPVSLPALTQAQEIQDRAARVGFDWPDIEGVISKINEEINEIKAATNIVELNSEIGDLLFAIVNLSRWKNIDAETTLREASKRFKRRFAHIEEFARRKGISLHEMTLDEMEVLWQEGKGQH